MNSKSMVCEMYIFNKVNSLYEGLLEKSLAFTLLQAYIYIFFLGRQVEKTGCEMRTDTILQPCLVSANCTISGLMIHKYTNTNSCCFVSWFLKEQSSQHDLLVKVDRKYQAQQHKRLFYWIYKHLIRERKMYSLVTKPARLIGQWSDLVLPIYYCIFFSNLCFLGADLLKQAVKLQDVFTFERSQ